MYDLMLRNANDNQRIDYKGFFKQFESNDYEHLASLKEAFVNPKQIPNLMNIGSQVGFTCSMSIELQS